MKKLSLAIVCVLTMAAWTSAQSPLPDCPDLVRALQDMMRAVIALHPDVVVILAGTNDIAGNTGPMTDAEIEGNLTSMCELAQASRIRVVLSSITPVGEAHRRAPARIVAINTWLRAYAAEHHPVYLDYYAAMVDERGLLQADLSEDDLHPNAKGYAVMAPLAEAAVQRALAIAWR